MCNCKSSTAVSWAMTWVAMAVVQVILTIVFVVTISEYNKSQGHTGVLAFDPAPNIIEFVWALLAAAFLAFGYKKSNGGLLCAAQVFGVIGAISAFVIAGLWGLFAAAITFISGVICGSTHPGAAEACSSLSLLSLILWVVVVWHVLWGIFWIMGTCVACNAKKELDTGGLAGSDAYPASNPPLATAVATPVGDKA